MTETTIADMIGAMVTGVATVMAATATAGAGTVATVMAAMAVGIVMVSRVAADMAADIPVGDAAATGKSVIWHAGRT